MIFATVPIESVTPIEGNNEKRVLALMADIKRNGLIAPITVDEAGYLLDGRDRLEACKRLGHSHIKCAIKYNIPEEVAKNIIPFLDQIKESIKCQPTTLEEYKAQMIRIINSAESIDEIKELLRKIL